MSTRDGSLRWKRKSRGLSQTREPERGLSSFSNNLDSEEFIFTRRFFAIIALVLAISILTYGQGNTFKKVRYQGGSVASSVKPDDWGNTPGGAKEFGPVREPLNSTQV